MRIGKILSSIIMIILASVSLSGCKTYSSSFACGDAEGADCVSMDMVDRMITSGEIERFNEQRKCSSGGCKYKNKQRKKRTELMQRTHDPLQGAYYFDTENSELEDEDSIEEIIEYR